ncbi:uncharacterized protein LOC128218001 [Mya arenaria]|uniref:uncharacterized protein LOC128218001 n=1 Tax=Mya arenaria TaxID=6604 RepID=UPI0022E90F6E|nr:uncharacterized protein LOC128218001 [Mya arenaria]
MLPSSYRRRLRTRDLLQRPMPEMTLRLPTRISNQTLTKAEMADLRATHSYFPYMLRERTRTMRSSLVSGQINQVLEHLTEIDRKAEEEAAVFAKKVRLTYPRELRDTPIPPVRLERQFSRVSGAGMAPRLQPIDEGHESRRSIQSNTPTSKNAKTQEIKSKNKLKDAKGNSGKLKDLKSSAKDVNKRVKKKVPEKIIDTIENLTRARMIELAKQLMKDKRMSQCYKRNPNRIELLPPIVFEGTPAWSHEVKSDLYILVPIKSLRYIKWKYAVRETGYIEVTLPAKPPKNRIDLYAAVRADDNVHLSTSRLNRALVEVFLEGLKVAKFGEYTLMPELNFDYLNDTLELVFTKHLRIPMVPMVYLGADEPYYTIRPNLPDLDPTSDTLFRACYAIQEENIFSKVSSTDHGLRFDALKVIHTLCKQDWRLQSLSVYQLKNVLMHDIDFEIDHSPRWQRLTRDVCVQAILKRLLYFVKKQRLPHFFESRIDLFRGISAKTLALMRTPLERFVSNEAQLLRDLQRASRDRPSSSSSSESDEDWW